MTSMEMNNIIEKCKRLGFTGFTIEELIDAFIVYLRKSRSDEEVEKYIKTINPDITKEELDKEILKRHENQIQAYAKETLGFKIPEKNIRREVKSGGELEEREVMKELLLEIESPKILGVFVVDIDRIGRPDALDTGLLIQAFELTETKILVATPPKIWDLTDDFDKDYFEDSLRQARKFLNYTKTKMTNGRKQSVREGKFIGRTAPFGYNKVKIQNEKGYTLEPNEDAEIVKEIFDMYLNQGFGSMRIARYLNNKGIKPPEKDAWEYEMVRSILKRKTYAGYVSYGNMTTVKTKKDGKVTKRRIKNENALIKKGRHEPLIDEESFNIIQQRLEKKAFKNVPNNEILQNPLAGLVKCKCGRTMARRKQRLTIAIDEENHIDKKEFATYITKLKENKNLMYKDIVELSGISRNAVSRYFDKKSTAFPKNDYYKRLKEVLGMDDRYDVLSGKKKHYKIVHSLYCPGMTCNVVCSYIPELEDEVLRQLKKRLKEYTTFLDNYYQDEVKVTKDYKKEISNLEKDIEGLQNQIANACDLLERKLYTDEMFLNRVNTLNIQIEQKKNQINELQATDIKEEIIQYEKAVPILKTALNNYHTFTIEEKNEFLHSFIETIVYNKTQKRSKWDLSSTDMKLDITFKEL